MAGCGANPQRENALAVAATGERGDLFERNGRRTQVGPFRHRQGPALCLRSVQLTRAPTCRRTGESIGRPEWSGDRGKSKARPQAAGFSSISFATEPSFRSCSGFNALIQ